MIIIIVIIIIKEKIMGKNMKRNKEQMKSSYY